MSKYLSLRLAGNFGTTEKTVRLLLRAGHAVAGVAGHKTMIRLSGPAAALGAPAWSADVPRAAGPLPDTSREGARALYFPACVTRVLGPDPGEPSVARRLVDVARRAGVPVWIPPSVEGTCCGMPFSSKGFGAAHDECVNSLIRRLWEWSGRGRLPVVIDTSPCAWTLRSCRECLTGENKERFDGLRILDSVVFAREMVLPGLDVRRKAGPVVLHPVCSVVKMGLAGTLRDVAAACAEEVVIPVEAGCCGFAGDRGFLLPELTDSATRIEAAEIRARNFDGHFSTSRTCEIGMQRATGREWRSIWALLDEASR